jgi:uncharacterized protein (DUF4415 family)
MRSKVKFTDPGKEINDAIDAAIPVADFLPPPSELVFRVRKEKVTMNLDADVVDFYRTTAKSHSVAYQALINEVLRAYKDAKLAAA